MYIFLRLKKIAVNCFAWFEVDLPFQICSYFLKEKSEKVSNLDFLIFRLHDYGLLIEFFLFVFFVKEQNICIYSYVQYLLVLCLGQYVALENNQYNKNRSLAIMNWCTSLILKRWILGTLIGNLSSFALMGYISICARY